MRLIRCYVENFGTLSGFDYNFLPGLNTINEVNGWGKSTFSVFLKVMFFGFENEKKRASLEKERTRYMPWKGGAYGGWVVFEVKGKQYRMERYFGEKEREDSFVLYEEKTGLFSHDFSKEIGKELFQLDEPSFKKSIFLSQTDCVAGTTDAIHAKLGNLSEYVHDLDGFSEAQKRLAKEINRLTPYRKTGELYKIKEKIESCQWQLHTYTKQEEELAVCNQYFEEKKKNRAELSKQIQQMQEGVLSVGKEKEKQAKLAHYNQLCSQCDGVEERLEEIEAHFINGIPEISEVREMLSILEKEREAIITIENCAFTETEEEILAWVQENWKEIPTLEDVAECKNRLEENSQEKEVSEDAQDKEKVFSKIMSKLGTYPKIILMGIVLVIVGFILCYVNFFVGFFILAAGIFFIYHGKTEPKIEDEEETEKATESKVIEEKQDQTSDSDDFLIAHPVKNAEDAKEHLEQIQLILVQLNSILQRDKKKQQAKEWAVEYADEVKQFFDKYSMPEQEDKKLQLQDILGRLEQYQMLMNEFSKICNQKEAFVQENDIAFLKEESIVTEDIDDVDKALEQLQLQLEEVTDSMYAELKKIEVLQEQLDANEEIKTQLQQLEQEKAKKEKQFYVFEQTAHYLQQAKDSFLAKYRSPMEKGFSKYSRYLTKENLKFRIDTNMEIRLEQEGALRDTGCLSSGWQDLIGICMRFSLVDAMYPDEKPFLILDDPFVNMDEEKIRGGLWLLNQMEDEYQILYFTCHKSRTLDGFSGL